MQLLYLLPLALLAQGIPFTQPRETGAAVAAVAAREPAHAPMARRAVDMHAAALSQAQGSVARAEAVQALQAAVIEARQNGGSNYEPLLHLASLAGIPLPTDPGVLLGLAPEASKLLQALPTGPVLTALETAAPSGFISRIVHDPSFAASFESAFAAGSSPSWFLNLPTSVRDYLHTYDGIVTVVGEVGTVIASVTKAEASSDKSASASKSASNTESQSKGAASTSRTGGIVATDSATAQQSTSSALSTSASAGAAAAMPTPPAGAVGLSAMAIAAVLGAAVAM